VLLLGASNNRFSLRIHCIEAIPPKGKLVYLDLEATWKRGAKQSKAKQRQKQESKGEERGEEKWRSGRPRLIKETTKEKRRATTV